MDNGQFPFQPGQFAVLELDGFKRAYTIASAPGLDYMEFIIVLVPSGALTPRLWKLKTGDKIDVAPAAFGHIKMSDIPVGAPLLLIGTGTGIAMFRSMIQAGVLKDHKTTLMNGARYVADIGFRDEFAGIKDKNLSLIQIASREPLNGHQGRLTFAMENPAFSDKIPELDPATGLHIIMCGGPDMVDDFAAKFRDLGFTEASAANPHGNLHFEKY